MKIWLFSLGWNLKHGTLFGILVYTFHPLAFYIIRLRWIQICGITCRDLHVQIRKKQKATEMLKKIPYFLYNFVAQKHSSWFLQDCKLKKNNYCVFGTKLPFCDI